MLATSVKSSATTLRQASRRFLATSGNGGDQFRPRRKPNHMYRPLKAKGPSKKGPKIAHDFGASEPPELGNYKEGRNKLERDFGPDIADALRSRQRANRLGSELTTEEYLSMADYMTAAPGTLEEQQSERKALALDAWDEDDRDNFLKNVDDMIEKARVDSLELDEYHYSEEDEDNQLDENGKVKNAAILQMEKEIEAMEEEVDENGDPVDPLQLAHGQWYVVVLLVRWLCSCVERMMIALRIQLERYRFRFARGNRNSLKPTQYFSKRRDRSNNIANV